MSRLQQDQFVDDEEEECCPLCVEEFDLSDRNFRPCPCGYQVCYTARVWWSHLELPY
jgi:CCR4-NOT transcription complex subunit 4